METNKELNALFKLIDDPDEEVFSAVTNRLVVYGKSIIPHLEHLWENTFQQPVQERIEVLVHKLHFNELKEEFIRWNEHSHPDLLTGSMLVARFQYPELTMAQVYQDIEKLRRNIWLELNSYLTPLEQVNVLTSILYNFYNLRGEEVNYQNSDEFFIHKVLETKKGNSISNGILYVILSELLDVPVRAVNIPKQFVLGYFKMDYDFSRHTEDPHYRAEFFIDPMSGHVFTYTEVEAYFERIQMPPDQSFYEQLDSRRIIRQLIDELSKCYTEGKDRYKRDELQSLATLLPC
jgi:regulator of sirC expression with transglutaminase-like and TPR domain